MSLLSVLMIKAVGSSDVFFIYLQVHKVLQPRIPTPVLL
jgi:hypothetical protein